MPCEKLCGMRQLPREDLVEEHELCVKTVALPGNLAWLSLPLKK